MPLAVGLSVAGAAHGYAALSALAGLFAVPEDPTIRSLVKYAQHHPDLVQTLVCTALSVAGVLFVFLVMPAGDLLFGRDLRPAVEGAGAKQSGAAYRAMLYSFALAHWALLLTACQAVSSEQIPPLAFLGLVLSVGCQGGFFMTVCHELVHGRTALDRAACDALLASMGLMHWRNGHLAHHLKVATRADPASARRGESLYAFVPRSAWGALADGCAWELQRLRARGLRAHSLHNRILWWAALPLGLLGGVDAAWGHAAAGLCVGQAAVAVVMMEMVNYVEHYGLQRSRLPSGRYERVAARHSWNANWIFTNLCIFRLQRHSDHHLRATVPYQSLRDIKDAPQLPASYPAMMVLALWPPLFHRIMDARLAELAATNAPQQQAPAVPEEQ